MLKNIRENIVVKIVLYPLMLIYWIITGIRNLLFNKGILKQKSYDIPIISIGNIETGGTGKTPFTILLIELLQKQFCNIVVVSRGYGRKSRGLHIVSDGNGNIIHPDIGGDELLHQMRRRDNLSQTVIILTTADAVLAAELRSEVDLVLLKPISFRQLRDLAVRLHP